MPKNKAKFVFRIDSAEEGKRLRPNSIPARDLAALISRLDSTLSAMVKQQYGADLGGFSITGISRGSLNISSEGAPAYGQAFTVFGKKISDLAGHRAPFVIDQAIEAIQDFNTTHNTVLELKRDKKSEPIATIYPKKTIDVDADLPPEISGETCLYGRVIGISGIERISIKLKLTTGENIDFPLPAKDVRRFGARYNETVGVSGIATWDTITGKTIRFQYQGMLFYEETSPSHAFGIMRDRFHTVFDAIEDVDAFVAEQRGK